MSNQNLRDFVSELLVGDKSEFARRVGINPSRRSASEERKNVLPKRSRVHSAGGGVSNASQIRQHACNKVPSDKGAQFHSGGKQKTSKAGESDSTEDVSSCQSEMAGSHLGSN